MARILLLSALLVGATSKKFNIAIDYTCITPSDTSLPCRQWTQSGTVEEEVSCYPGDAIVMTKGGPKTMADLEVGDAILGFNSALSKNEYTSIRSWLHRFPTKFGKYDILQTKKGDIAVSEYHNVAELASETLQLSYTFAKDLGKGSLLRSSDGEPANVTSVKKGLLKEGMYAPLTGTSNFYVGSSASELFLSHSFAHISNPVMYEMPVHAAMTGAEWIMNDAHELPSDNAEDYVHPVARNLQTVFPFLVEKAPTRRKLYANSYNNENDDEMYLVLANMANSVLL